MYQFSLASHDLDIRGGGNLLGEEQSGHIREVGFELYQSMLEEAITTLKGEGGGMASREQWSPQIGLGITSLIPEAYVADLQVHHIPVVPSHRVGSHRMGRTFAYLGPKPVIELHAAGLKVGEVMARARLEGYPVDEVEQITLRNAPAQLIQI